MLIMSNLDVVQSTAATPLPSQLGSAVAATVSATLKMPPTTAAAAMASTMSKAAMAARTPVATTLTSPSPPPSSIARTSTSTPTNPVSLHPPLTPPASATAPSSRSPIGKIGGTKRTRSSESKDSRIAKSRQRPVFSKSMDPPVLSFYGTQPVPLPSRFASVKRRLVAGHEAALEASWGRLIAALRDEVKYIDEHRKELIPSINFSDIHDASKVGPFGDCLKRHGIGVIRGVVPREDASHWVEETKKYLEMKHEFKPPPAQDPTCFDFFWTPAQVRSRAHPHMLKAQRFAMSLWNANDDDRLATKFPITYADRIRIESSANGITTINGVAAAAASASHEDSLIAAAAATSEVAMAQIDNGSLERWEPDGYGRCGLYDDIFKGNWEAYNAWDPAGRINATSDLYNGAGACSMMRLFQGILALTVVEPGMISLLPSPKLSTVYFLLRPFFSPKEPAPEQGATVEQWEKYLDPSNWTLDKEQSTIIHGAVPGHAQRVTAAWHPHLELDKSLVTPPTLQPGDYIVWHPDQAYQFSNTHSRPGPKPGSSDAEETSMLVYSPAAPLTQTNALFLARQRKAFLRGHPGPDFDSTGTGLGSEAPHTGRPSEKEIKEVGGEEGLRAMGLAPWISSKDATPFDTPRDTPRETPRATPRTRSPVEEKKEKDVEMVPPRSARESSAAVRPSSRAEAEVVRLANIILFPDRYDFYMPTRASSPVPSAKDKDKDADRFLVPEKAGEKIARKLGEAKKEIESKAQSKP
ncbi:hypothetical protein GGR57DRAFT_477957 [Xylariaceae sp. FL1272]|nr:hypothetical protein GGR57DRAFT_477957 [Xylariaceae sp. FL1272]